MIRNRLIWIRRVTGLALLAALISSVLPAGLMPKVAGRCGRVLCSCAPDTDVQPAQCKTCRIQHHSSHNLLSLVETEISGAETPGIAFFEVFSGALAPYEPAIPPATDRSEWVSPDCAAFAVLSVSFDIPTPPPKA